VIEWIEKVLGVIAIACVFLGMIIILMMINAVVKRIKKTKKEKKTMSKEKGETVTFNDIFMFMIGVPLVLLWVGFLRTLRHIQL
jgi:Na+/melibiose symporter-like transporter